MLLSISDKSEKICERIVKAGLHADMLKNLSWETLSAATLKESSGKREFVRAQDSILHNVVRRIESARGAFRKLGAVNVAQKFRDIAKELVIFCSHLFRHGGVKATTFEAKAKDLTAKAKAR